MILFAHVRVYNIAITFSSIIRMETILQDGSHFQNMYLNTVHFIQISAITFKASYLSEYCWEYACLYHVILIL